MADQTSEKTLDSTPTAVPDQPPSAPSLDGGSESDPPLTRNSSFSKLNAKAPEFVPMKTQPTPNSVSPPPPPANSLMIAPPPPPPPAMLHVYPGGPPTPYPVSVPVPIPGQGAHLAHMHHQQQQQQQKQQQHGNHSNSGYHHHQQNHHHHHRHHNHQKHHNQFHGSGSGGEQEGGGQPAQNEKDQGQGNGVSRNGLSDEAAQKLINQVEYYFSDVNLATTDHLIRFINKDPEGFVPISVVASFKKIKALISSNSQLAAVLRNSTKLVVSEDGKKVKRLHPLTGSDMEELQARIIVAENLPDDHCHQNLMKIFSAVGSVKSIRTCLPQPFNNGANSAARPSKTDNILYINKLHAFVEYESVELAEKAIVELNDEDDWRNGLRVRLLHKRGSKPAQGRAKKAGNEGDVTCEEEDASTSEQNLNERQSEDPSGQADVQSHEHVEEPNLEKEGGGQRKGRNRGRGKGRGRGQHHHQNNRGNHMGGPPMNNAANVEQPAVAKQQPPGPRMPDGTRGFSMGRGKPLTDITATAK